MHWAQCAHMVGVFASCSQEVCPCVSFLSNSVPNQGGLIQSLLSSWLMSPSDRSLASTSLMTSRLICPTDTGHLHLNIPWAPQVYLCHFKLVLFLIFSSTRYSAPCKTPGSHTVLYLPSLRLLMYFRMEWLSLIPKVSLTSSCLLISHLLNQLLPLLPLKTCISPLLASGGPRFPLACGSIAPVSASVFMWPFSFYVSLCPLLFL